MRRLAVAAGTRWLAVVFLACALPTGLCLALLTPIGQVADEPAHIARAAGLLHGQIMGQRFVLNDPVSHQSFFSSGTMVNGGLISAANAETRPNHRGPTTPAEITAAAAVPWRFGPDARGIDSAPNTVQYFPALYLPGTFGIALMRHWGGTPLQALYAGRVAMLIFYIAVGMAAIAVSAFGRPLLFAVLSLPMALSLAGSFNQDGALIAMTALAGALLTLDPRRHPRLRFAALPIFSLVLCSKPPYGLLMFAFLWPLAAPGLWRRLLAVLIFALPPLIWVILMMRDAEVPYHLAAYHPGPFWPGDPTLVLHGTDAVANLRVLLAKPSRFFHMPVHFLLHGEAWHLLILQAIGWLGWLKVPLARWAYRGWEISLLCAAAASLLGPGRGIAWRPLDAVFVLLLVVVSSFAIEIAIYLSWDPVGQALITGPQGRYYLLFIPFLMLAIPRPAPKPVPRPSAGRIEAALALPALAMAAIDTGYLPWLVLHRFYLG